MSPKQNVAAYKIKRLMYAARQRIAIHKA